MTHHSSLVTRHLKVALIGAAGMLAADVRRFCPAEIDLHGYDLPELDITRRDQVLALAEKDFDVIINCAAYTNVDGSESNRDQAWAVNATGPGYLAQLAKQTGALLVHLSTDFVFNGQKTTPYLETDVPEPLSWYGRSKHAGEQEVMNAPLDSYLIIRTSWLYGAAGANFVKTIARLAAEREDLGIVADQIGSPTSSVDLAQAVWTLIAAWQVTPEQISGIYHFSNEGVCSWYDFACTIVEHLRRTGAPVKTTTLRPITTAEYPLAAVRPAYSVLSKDKYKQVTGAEVPEWRESLRAYFNAGS